MPKNAVFAASDSAYPSRLAEVKDRPEVLHVRGDMPSQGPLVAIVGARAASAGALEDARRLAADVASRGGVVVSGGAYGVDAAAHRGALEAGGRTIAVQGCGLSHVYPSRHQALFAAIAESGAVVSPFADDMPPRRWRFVRRNRVIAAMVDAVVVVEARIASGALYTASAAREYGRVLGAMPGSPGCEAILSQGGAVIADGDDLWAALSGDPRRPEVELPPQGSERMAVLAALAPQQPTPTSDIAFQTGLPVRSISRALSDLELDGLVLPLPGREYVRSQLAESVLGGTAPQP